MFFNGCGSPSRTLEWKGPKVVMTEERRIGMPPRLWELRVVSGRAKLNALSRDGWKLVNASAMISTQWHRVDGTALRYVLHKDQDVDTFLMKRKMNAKTAASVAATSQAFYPMLITTQGNYLSPDGFWEIGVSATSLDFKYFARRPDEGVSRSVSTNPQGWKTHPGWFVFIENEFRTWAYDGDRYLLLQEETSNGTKFKGTSYEDGFPCPVPAEVFSRLSKEKKREM